MKKITLFLVVLIMTISSVRAGDYVTSGDGTTYTLESLSGIANSGVTKSDAVYTMANNVTISAKDQFNIESGVTVKMGNAVLLRIEGSANFEAAQRTLLTRNEATDKPKGVMMLDETKITKFKNLDFEYCGLRNFSSTGFDVDNCTFRFNNGANASAGAISLGSSGASFNITNSTFESNTVPAIGGAANYTCGVYIDNCTFNDNNTANSNKPQLNITVGGDHSITIKNSTLIGSKRTMVGAIAVSNMIGLTGINNVLIENNDIRYHRYGITVLGQQNVLIKDNMIVDNQYETNPMNGGSGISIYDSTKKQVATITGNHIEKSLWGITVIGGKEVNAGKVEDPLASDYNPGGNVFKDNGNNGVLYDLYNNTTITVYAQGNKWNVDEQTAEKIESVIYHKNDEGTLGEVIYMPAMTGGSVSSVVSKDEIYFADGKIIIDENSAANVDVYALNGALVTSIKAENGIADISFLDKGVYVARVTTSNGISVIKCTL